MTHPILQLHHHDGQGSPQHQANSSHDLPRSRPGAAHIVNAPPSASRQSSQEFDRPLRVDDQESRASVGQPGAQGLLAPAWIDLATKEIQPGSDALGPRVGEDNPCGGRRSAMKRFPLRDHGRHEQGPGPPRPHGTRHPRESLHARRSPPQGVSPSSPCGESVTLTTRSPPGRRTMTCFAFTKKLNLELSAVTRRRDTRPHV